MKTISELRGRDGRALALALTVLFVSFSCGQVRHQSLAPVRPPEPAPVVEKVPAEGRTAEADGENEDGYREATEFYLMKRSLPGEELPLDRYVAARQRTGRRDVAHPIHLRGRQRSRHL